MSLSAPSPQTLSCAPHFVSVYLCVSSLSSISVILVHSSAPEIHFSTTPLGSSPPWGEVSPAVIIFSLLVCRLKPSLSYLQGLKRPKHRAERQDFKTHSARQTSPTELFHSLCKCSIKQVAATHMLKIISVICLTPLKKRKFLFLKFILATSWLQSSQAITSQVSPVNQTLCAIWCNLPSVFLLMKAEFL